MTNAEHAATASTHVAAFDLPCSQSQKRFWFESLLHPDNPGLNVAVRWRLDGAVDHAILEQAWQLIVARHLTLRSSFTTLDGEPHQVVVPSLAFRVPLLDLATMSEDDAYAQADRLAASEAQRTFDITVAPLLRVTHLRVRPAISILLVTAHHTVCDGWSVGILAREMGEAYAALAAGERPALPELAFTYADYVAWERESMSGSGSFAAVPADLRQQLHAFEPFEILTDLPRPAIQTANGEIVSALLERELTDGVAGLARRNGATLFMAAYAVLLALLYRQSGQSDIVIGTQIAGREEVDFEPLVGTFINTIALRTDVAGEPSFVELLERARDTVSDALELRHVPLEELVEIVNPKRDLSRNALFSVNFVYQRSFIENAPYGAIKLTDLPSKSAGPICDLNFFMVERPDGWRMSCEFNTDLYRRETVTCLLERFVRLMREAVRDPGASIASLPLVDDVERGRLIALGSGDRTSYGRNDTVHDLFTQQAERTPGAIAAIDGRGSLTYAELDRRSNQLARYLVSAGVAPRTPLGVSLERSIDVPIVLLAILKTGAAYVPLDPAYPRERLDFMMADAGVNIVLTDRSIALARGEIAALDDTPCDIAAGAGDTAYIMYTSGSSGRPKGVAVAHRAIARLVRATNYVDIRAGDTVLHLAPLAFDASTFEVWAPLLNGGRLAIAPPGTLSLAELDRTLAAFEVTTLWLTAAMFREAVEGRLAAFGRLRTMLAGGDVVSPAHAQRFVDEHPNCRLINGYGPTENTTFSCTYVVPPGSTVGANVPIGRPIANSSAYVLDGRMELAPPGVVGELYVGGDGIARGYLNLPELTAERFVPDPFAPGPDARLYRTGDRVRQRDDGTIEFLGRLDDQVKIRGYRIEPRELEVVLASHPQIAGAVAVAADTPSGDKTLLAYIVMREGAAAEPDVAVLRAWLAERMPAFMVPSAIVALPALPLTANGKIDLRALPAPGGHHPIARRTSDSVIEARLTAMLCALLGRETIDRDVDLFSIGFHSMLAIRFVARVQSEMGFELQLRGLFERPTIAATAAQIESPAAGGSRSGSRAVVRLNASGARPPLFYLHGDLFAQGLYARKLAAAIGSDQPVFSIAPHGTEGLPLLTTVESMARDYVERIRRIQPHGPYRLGGFCASGLVAYEIACILRAAGETVDAVLLLNSSPLPNERIAALDWLVRRIGSDARLSSRVRDSLCYNLARVHAALVTGPVATVSVLRRLLSASVRRSRTNVDPLEPEHFEQRRGAEDTKNSFAHIVAALTYHPRRYAGDVTLIWGEEQATIFEERTMGWGAVAEHVTIVSMRGGHVGSLSGRVEELAGAFHTALAGVTSPC